MCAVRTAPAAGPQRESSRVKKLPVGAGSFWCPRHLSALGAPRITWSTCVNRGALAGASSEPSRRAVTARMRRTSSVVGDVRGQIRATDDARELHPDAGLGRNLPDRTSQKVTIARSDNVGVTPNPELLHPVDGWGEGYQRRAMTVASERAASSNCGTNSTSCSMLARKAGAAVATAATTSLFTKTGTLMARISSSCSSSATA